MSETTKTSGMAPAGEALLGRVIDAAGEPLDGGGSLAELPRLPIDRPVGADAPGAARATLLESGIKPIDLYAPIARGGTVPLIAVPGTGMIVVSTELTHNIASRRGGCAVMVDLGDHTFSTNDLIAELRGGGVDRHTVLIAGQQGDPPEMQRQLALMGLTLAEYFCDRGRETLLFMDERLVSQSTAARLRERRRGASAGLTLLVWHVRTPDTFDPDQILQGLPLETDGRLVFSRALAKQSIWPAVDPLASTSRLLDEQCLDAEHGRVARATQELLRNNGDIEGTGAAGGDTRLRARARRVLLFQGQPFSVAETFTGLPGEYVGVEETVRGFAAIVAGRHDDVPEETFRFTGTLDQVLARAAA
jgi:F-type H+/Na+-transporting ATPase subunit beta